MTDRAKVRPLARNEIVSRLDDLARLRITVFRAFPYLYDGDMDYERRYLATYLEADGAFVAGAFDGDELVGAATAAPLGMKRSSGSATKLPTTVIGVSP